MPPRAAAARNARARTPEERAVETLKSMANQALRLASGRDACAWSPTEVNAASEAIDTLGPKVLYAMGESRLAGLVIMLGLALRRATPSSPGISDGQRSAYATLHPKLTTALVHVGEEVASGDFSGAAPLEVCTALIKSHVLRAFCPLLAAAASPLLPGPQPPPPQQPSRRSVQCALALAGQVRSALGLMAGTAKQGHTSEQRTSLTATLATELAESGLLEHWARLVLGLGACEDGEDGAAKEVAQLGRHLVVFAGYDCTSLQHLNRLDPWTELLLSGPCPCLAYLLSSHLVAFAAELDGGPTYGLPPAAPEVQLAGPSSSSAQPSRPRPPVPLVDTAGFPLRPRKALGAHLAAPALRLWTGVLKAAGQTCSSMAWPTSAKRRRTGAWGGGLAGPSNLGMRLATSMAYSLRVYKSTFQLFAADCSIDTRPWGALTTAHDPAAWLDPAAPPLQSAAAVGRMDFGDTALMAKLGLSLAREALEPARVLADMPGQAAALAQLEKQLGAWWRAALAWAGLWTVKAGGSLPALRWDLLEELLEMRGLPGTPNSLDARLAMSSGFLPVLEAVLRHPDGQSLLMDAHKPSNPFDCNLWGSAILQAGPLPVASFCASIAKLLNSVKLKAMKDQGVARNRQRMPFPRGLLKLATAGFRLVSPRSKTHVAVIPGEQGDPDPGAGQDLAGPSDGAAGPSHAPAAASGGGSSPPEAAPQLPLTAACVALHLLPGAAALARVLYVVTPDQIFDRSPDCTDGLVNLLELLLAWVPPILLAAEPLEVAAVGPGAPASPASPSPSLSAAAATSSDAAEKWSRFLWEELGLAWVLGAAASLLTMDAGAANARLYLTSPLTAALWALVGRAPARLAAVIAAADEAAAATAGAGGDAAARGPSLDLLQRALRIAMRCPVAERDELLDAVEATCVSAWVRTPDPSMGAAVEWPRARFYHAATSLLASPAEAGQVLLRCAYPDCTHLAGPSEAAVKRQRCGGCMRARYCSQACQAAHWAASHAQECRAAAGEAEPIDLSTA
ncbi:hypothetical protein HYH03_014579 [Edaphochlamys debaryana]|uniref:MYND-type domain-containing protein n=1 Tax=Edaphochlamys debaryana TaxID=47281 RepID=A0A835XNL3_9CHLO|nr:hypothetical protein HYH03_014579 [Edaphochlamys debaryana]|eukprot:KAG2486780.1 hypothetical protein HYH03_014579 [Edaphochlamys debaryana]